MFRDVEMSPQKLTATIFMIRRSAKADVWSWDMDINITIISTSIFKAVEHNLSIFKFLLCSLMEHLKCTMLLRFYSYKLYQYSIYLFIKFIRYVLQLTSVLQGFSILQMLWSNLQVQADDPPSTLNQK